MSPRVKAGLSGFEVEWEKRLKDPSASKKLIKNQSTEEEKKEQVGNGFKPIYCDRRAELLMLDFVPTFSISEK